MKRHLDSPIGVDPNLLFWPSPRTFHLLYSFYCERRLISIYIPETLGGVSASIKRHIDSRCFPSSPSPSIIAAPLTVGSKYMAASISIIPIHTVLSLAAFTVGSFADLANASRNCLSSLPCNLKVDGRSQYLCQPTLMGLTYSYSTQSDQTKSERFYCTTALSASFKSNYFVLLIALARTCIYTHLVWLPTTLNHYFDGATVSYCSRET
ncbi:BnaC01g42960D [Brassica napus]|uniref:BnaC01g42960D protein n=1 Tax=Brassica napus TaxID=3708 RepID=A0A078J627_BRANA|nr:BnaC01g42960D [Brassica napus]